MALGLGEGGNLRRGIPQRVDKLVKFPFLPIDLLFSEVALADEVIVAGLMFEVGEADLLHHLSVISLEKFHILCKILLMVDKYSFDALVAFLLLAGQQFLALSFAAIHYCLKTPLLEVLFVNRNEFLVSAFLCWAPAIGQSHPPLDLPHLHL